MAMANVSTGLYVLAGMHVNGYIAMMKTERFEMRANPEFLKLIDEWRRSQPDLPPRAEAVRRIVETALSSSEPPTLSVLLREWFTANPERHPEFGFDGSISVEQCVAALLNDRYQSPVVPAKQMIELFNNEADPIAKQIVALLERVAR